VIILDTGGIYAFLDSDDSDHEASRAIVDADPGPFVLSPFVLAELDYLVQQRLGVRAECELLDDVDAGVYTLVAFGDDDMSQATSLVKKYADLGIGVTDASVAVVAARYRTVDLLSTDERHFRAIRPVRGGEAFRLLLYDH
jgi:predicted nucleic acid-binding protein